MDTRPEMLFSLILDTGIKKSEAVALKPADIDRSNLEKPVLTIKPKCEISQRRRIDLDPDWLRLLIEYMMQYVPKDSSSCTARNLVIHTLDVGEAGWRSAKISFEMIALVERCA